MSKTLPGYETLLLIPAVDVNGVPWIATPDGLVDYETVDSDTLNTYLVITKPSDANAAQGGNISKAVLDDLSLGLTSSDTDSTKNIVSKGNSETPTFYNFNAELNFQRDEDLTADSIENLARDLTRAPDVGYFIAHRVRGQKDWLELAEIGDEWDLYYVLTDVQILGYSDGEAMEAQSSFIPKNIVNVRHILSA